MGPHGQRRASGPGVDNAVDQVVRMTLLLRQLRAARVPDVAYIPPRIGTKFFALTWTERGATRRWVEDDLKKLADWAEEHWLSSSRPHAALIVEDSAYSVEGMNTGCPANLGWPNHYPMEAICSICHDVVRRERIDPDQLDWMHTGRKAGDPR